MWWSALNIVFFLSHLPYSVSGILASTQQVIHPSFFISADMRKQEGSFWTYLRRVFTRVRFELNTFLIFVWLAGSSELEWTEWFFLFWGLLLNSWKVILLVIPELCLFWYKYIIWCLNFDYLDFPPKRLFSFVVFGSSSINWFILDCVCSGTLIIAWIIHCIVFGGTDLREVAPL